MASSSDSCSDSTCCFKVEFSAIRLALATLSLAPAGLAATVPRRTTTWAASAAASAAAARCSASAAVSAAASASSTAAWAAASASACACCAEARAASSSSTRACSSSASDWPEAASSSSTLLRDACSMGRRASNSSFNSSNSAWLGPLEAAVAGAGEAGAGGGLEGGGSTLPSSAAAGGGAASSPAAPSLSAPSPSSPPSATDAGRGVVRVPSPRRRMACAWLEARVMASDSRRFHVDFVWRARALSSTDMPLPRPAPERRLGLDSSCCASTRALSAEIHASSSSLSRVAVLRVKVRTGVVKSKARPGGFFASLFSSTDNTMVRSMEPVGAPATSVSLL